jgi:tetratricopeptide (TPR) repeat protein
LGEREQTEEAVRKVLERTTDADDSHPSPKDRFALAARSHAEDRPVGLELVWDLLAENDAVLSELRTAVGEEVGLEVGRMQALQAVHLDKLSWTLRLSSAPRDYVERARIYLSRGDYAKAIDDLTRALAKQPHAADIRWQRALAYQAQGQPELAVKDVTRILQRPGPAPLSAEERCSLYAMLGDCQAQGGRLAEALEAYGEALRANPVSLQGLVGRGRTYRELGDYSAALADLSTALERWPASPEAYHERARVHDATGQHDEAAHDLAAARALAPVVDGGIVRVSTDPLVPIPLS